MPEVDHLDRFPKGKGRSGEYSGIGLIKQLTTPDVFGWFGEIALN
tara:strand:+ start:825 stop:959 length:135 start_codon:yes stop_codon:yes gene_type:complete